MIIQTLKHQYYILQKVQENEILEQFLGREEADVKGKKQYDIFRIKERRLVVKLILIFTEQMSNIAFEDFFECFSKEGELYLVFLHREENSLVEKLEEENCSLKERIEIGRKLLERILLLNMPDMLVYDVLVAERIQVTAAIDVYFLYSLEDIGRFEEITVQMVFERLAGVFELIFAYELSLEASVDIPEFLESIRKGEYMDYFQVYQEYLELAEKLQYASGSLKPNTFWFRVWEKIKKIYKFIKPILAALVLLAIVGYLIYSILNPKIDPFKKYDFKAVGTLNIQSQQEETGKIEIQP